MSISERENSKLRLTISDIIISNRHKNRVTRRELAFILGVHRTTINRWELGRIVISRKHALTLINVLDLSEIDSINLLRSIDILKGRPELNLPDLHPNTKLKY